MFDERIREINCGEIEGTTEEERLNKWGSNWRKMNLGMEEFENVSNRGFEFLQEFATKYRNKRNIEGKWGCMLYNCTQHLCE